MNDKEIINDDNMNEGDILDIIIKAYDKNIVNYGKGRPPLYDNNEGGLALFAKETRAFFE